MQPHKIVSREEWLAARKTHLAHEKQLTIARDRLAEERRALPWVKVEKAYSFDGPDGAQTLSDLFAGRSQLVVQHFMFAPDWEEGCKSCSFWADGFERMIPHLAARDTTLVAISRAPLAKLEAFRKRMGWTFRWLSTDGNAFAYDYHASFRAEELAAGEVIYNYRQIKLSNTDHTGISVFYRDTDGAIYHTYSCYSRGVDMMNAGYHYLDLVPKGRDEDGLPYNQAWVRERDKYGNPGGV